MKKCFLFGLLLALIASCRKDSGTNPLPVPNPVVPEEICPPPPTEVTPPPSDIRGTMYLNSFYKEAEGFPRIIGDSLLENSVLAWHKDQGLTELNVSGIKQLSDADSLAHLCAFVNKAHSAPYGLKVNFIVGSAAAADAAIAYCADYSNLPDGVITEYEFWRPGNSFATFETILSRTTELHNTYPSISRYAYVGAFDDEADVYSTDYITESLIHNCEIIFFAFYVEDAYEAESTLKAKLEPLSDKANELDEVANVGIIFMVHPQSNSNSTGTYDIYPYFSGDDHNHHFAYAYTNLMGEYNAAYDEDSDGLSFKGYAIFHYTDAKLARP